MDPQPQKIYIVTSGSYSEYGIEAVFTDRALAEAYADAMSDKEVEIEEYEANTAKPDDSLKLYRVVVSPDSVRSCEFSTSVTLKDTITCNPFDSDRYELYVLAASRDKAQAIALERYHAFLTVKHTHFPLIQENIVFVNPNDKEPNHSYCMPVYGFFDHKIYFSSFECLLNYLPGVAKALDIKMSDGDLSTLSCAHDRWKFERHCRNCICNPLIPNDIKTISRFLDKFKSRGVILCVNGTDPYDFLNDKGRDY